MIVIKVINIDPDRREERESRNVIFSPTHITHWSPENLTLSNNVSSR